MPHNKLKTAIRARQAETGESYTAARGAVLAARGLPANYDLYVLFHGFCASFELEQARAEGANEETVAILQAQMQRLDHQIEALAWMRERPADLRPVAAGAAAAS